MGPELEKYRREVCQAEGHTHGEACELDCILRCIVRHQLAAKPSALAP